jgi:hypothetical protein
VEVFSRGSISVADLQVGDYVRVTNDYYDNTQVYSRVYSLAHKIAALPATYLQIHFSGPQSPLEISQDHMVWVRNRGMIPARNVAAGHALSGGTVIRIDTVQRLGAYAPLTEAGTIVVSGCVASNYVTFLTSSPAHQHDMAHSFFWFRRMKCWLQSCQNEEYDTETGFALWFVPIYSLGVFLMTLPSLVQFSLAAVAIPFLATAGAVERLFLLFPWPLAIMIVLVSARVGFKICTTATT